MLTKMEKKVSVELVESDWLRIIGVLRRSAMECDVRNFCSLARTDRRIADCIDVFLRSVPGLF